MQYNYPNWYLLINSRSALVIVYSGLRAADCKNQELADKSDFMDSFIFCTKKKRLENFYRTFQRVFVFKKFRKTWTVMFEYDTPLNFVKKLHKLNTLVT